MAGKNGADLIVAVQDNLGSIATGTIGVRSVDDVILDKINMVQLDILSRHPSVFSLLKRVATINVTTASALVSVPTQDVDGNTVEFVDFVALVLNDGTTHRTMQRVTALEKNQLMPAVDSSVQTGVPLYYNLFGSKFHLFPYPASTYTITLYGIVLPTAITTATTCIYGQSFDMALTAGATYLVYLALQEPNDAAAWLATYEKWLYNAVTMMRTKTDWNILPAKYPTTANPVDNPFVQSFNS